MVKKSGFTVVYGEKRKVWKPSECVAVSKPGKYRYLMPLDKKMRKQILPLSKPYPKKEDAEKIQLEFRGEASPK